MPVTFRRPAGHEAPVEVLLDKAHTFVVDVYEDDRPASISAANVQVQKPGGTDIVAKTSVTPSSGPEGSSNRLSYQLAAGSIDTLDENYVVTFFATVNSVEHEHRILYDVVKSEFTLTVREEDLFVLRPELRDMRELDLVEGTADSGSTSTLADSRLQTFADDHFNGGRLEIIDGTNEGEWREVTDFVRSTGTVTVSPVFASAIDTTSEYRLRRSWEPIIRDAHNEVRWRLKRKGFRPALILDAWEYHKAIVYLAAAKALESMADAPTDDPWELAEEYRAMYEDEFASTTPIYDVDEDAAPDSTRANVGVVVSRMH